MKKKVLVLGMVLAFSAVGTSASAYFNSKNVSGAVPSGYLSGHTEGDEGKVYSSTQYAIYSGNAKAGVYVEACIGSYNVLQRGANTGTNNAAVSISSFSDATEHHSSHYTTNQYESGIGLTLRVK